MVNGMRLNTKKTKEMSFSFSKRAGIDECAPLIAGTDTIERVTEFKILGVILSCDLSWKKHVDYIVARANKRLFVICQLVRCGFAHQDILSVYCAVIRPVLEYASPVWHCGLTVGLSDEIERIQKRCLRITFPYLSYSDSLAVAGLQRLSDRREAAVVRTFNDIKKPSHLLHSLLPVKPCNPGSATRDTYPYTLHIGKTARASCSLITYCVRKRL